MSKILALQKFSAGPVTFGASTSSIFCGGEGLSTCSIDCGGGGGDPGGGGGGGASTMSAQCINF